MPDGTSAYPVATNLFLTYQLTTVGAGVAADRDIRAVNQGSSSLTHFRVDVAGNVLNAASPDQIPLDDHPTLPDNPKPHPSTFSDFTGFGFRSFTKGNADPIFADGFESGCGM